MGINFKEAAQRHYKDAKLLEDNKRLPNADHLYGLAAECALKAIMVGLDANITSSDGDLVHQNHRVHIDMLWSEFRIFAEGRNAARYLSKLPDDNPFTDWRISNRYADDSHVPPKNTFNHRDGAGAALVALQRAIADGKVS